MGKGKKKVGGKKVAEDSSQTQPESEEPSTSVLSISEQVEEEGLGLGLGGARKKKQKQKTAQQQPAEVPEPTSAPCSVPMAQPAVAPAPEPQVEEEGLGLGLGGARKKKQKQKTAEQQPAEVPEQTSAPCSEPMTQPAVAPAPEPQVVVTTVTEEFEGLGLTGGGKKRNPRKKKKGDGLPSGDAQQQATASILPQSVVPPHETPQSTGPGQRDLIHQPMQTTSRQSTPEAGLSRQSTQQIAPSPSIPTGPWSQPALPTIGRGIGRGRGADSFPGRGQSAATVRPSPPQQDPPVSSSGSRGPPLPYSPSPPQQPPATAQYASRPEEAVLCRYKVPKKIPGGNIQMRQIYVLANYLPMKIKPLKISRYDVSFKPDRPKKLIPLAFKVVRNKYYPKEVLAFDQMKNCYSLRPLANIKPNDRFTTTVDVKDQNGRCVKFEVSFKDTGLVDLSKILTYMSTGETSLNPPTEEIQCVDVILRQGTLEAYIKAGRQFFQRPSKPIDLGDGLEMWTGLFQSAIFTSQPFVNIDVAHKGFPRQQPLIEAMIKDFGLDVTRPIERQRGRGVENFISFLKNLKVTTTLVGQTGSAGQKREFICNELVKPATEMFFLLNDPATNKERKINVADYFSKEKQYKLKYPNLNCIWVGPRDKNIYFPIELLEVAYGQAINKQLNETQLAKMVREAATPPDERLRKINEVIAHMNYSKNEQFKQFGLEISDQFYSVKAKILDPPNLEVGEGRVVPRKGAWQANKLLKPEPLQSWGFIAIETDPRCDHNNVIQLLKSTGRSLGMAVADPKLTRFDAQMRELRNLLFTALEMEIKFLFVIVSTRGRDYYHKVKQLAERDVGILTQCIKEVTASRKMNQMTAKNILLKVNSKLMGINQALDSRSLPRCLQEGGVMIVGADVTHPSPDQSGIPSIAAVTASIDQKCYKYNIELSIQTPKKEMIVQFEDMMVDHLQTYRKYQNSLPRKIFVFRDGVSEGQFAQVLNSELQAVHNAYRRMTGDAGKPEVLFLLVQKRHHTRFFQPKNCQYNVEPGTVVDCDIVHASELDFYLVSHQAIKGTARPTRYHALCNDGRLPDNEVEQLTYYLCHLYSRCMRAVSYPTPTYYAHLACLRARSLTYGEKFDNNELERKPKRLKVLDKMLQFSRMFFV